MRVVSHDPSGAGEGTSGDKVPFRAYRIDLPEGPFMSFSQGEWKTSPAEGFPNGGIMGARVRHHDWASTSLGPSQPGPKA